MEVTTKVSSNLLIAPSTIHADTVADDSEFTTQLSSAVRGQIEPVSTVDGITFHYTTEAKADGAKLDEGEYHKLNAAEDPTSAELDDFSDAYGTTGAKGFVDYAFELKADNTSGAARYINLKTLNLKYSGTDTNSLKPFRVVIFTEKATSNNTVYESDLVDADTTTILAYTGAANQTTNKAVNEDGDIASVTYTTFSGITVAANTTEYHRVVVRLYIEGEDKACTSSTFAYLTSQWELDMEWALEETQKTDSAFTSGKYTLVMTNYSINSTPVTGKDSANYYPVTDLTYNGAQVYTKATTWSDSSTLWTLSDADKTPSEITAQYDLK